MTKIFTQNTPLKELGEAELTLELLEHARKDNYELEMLNAISLAAFVHRGQLRANRSTLPRDTYLTHPLRNTLRLLRAGVVNKNILLASVLHDVVEDGASKISTLSTFHHSLDSINFQMYDKKHAEKLAERSTAVAYLYDNFPAEVARIVVNVSNPIYEVRPPKEERIDLYIEHLSTVFTESDSALVKISDLIDNGAGLYHNTGMTDGAFKFLASKYLKALPMALEALNRPDVLNHFTSVSGYLDMRDKLLKGTERLENLTLDI